jgi:predicted RNA-binding protein associated with RNAse of E/G family
MAWSRGDAIALREVWHGRVWRVVAGRVVEDASDRIVLFFARGMSGRYPVRADGSELRVPTEAWTLARRKGTRDVLALFVPGGRHSIWHFRRPDGTHDHWYVNFEQPLVRTPVGFDYRDEKLDLVVPVDGAIRWKDEDELAEAARYGLVDADAVRAEAARVVASPPWPTGWETWQPDPAWDVPALPEGWDVVRG